MVESAQNWTQGFHDAKRADSLRDSAYPYPIVVISEDDGSNNTLNHGLCTEFENGSDSDIAGDAQLIWADVFIPPIQARLNTALPGANLSVSETINIMDLCPFNTVASPNGTISPFCALFSEEEWHQYVFRPQPPTFQCKVVTDHFLPRYGYYETLNKYYGFSYG